MISPKKSGYIVETKSGKLGRTIHEKGVVNGKIPVYLAIKIHEDKDVKISLLYSEKAILCNPATLKKIGFID